MQGPTKPAAAWLPEWTCVCDSPRPARRAAALESAEAAEQADTDDVREGKAARPSQLIRGVSRTDSGSTLRTSRAHRGSGVAWRVRTRTAKRFDYERSTSRV